jgi:general secretion pathway protein B
MTNANSRSQRISIDKLSPGMVVIKITQQNGPVKVRKSGTITSFEMVQGLTEMGVLEVEIDPSQTLDIESSTASNVPSRTQQLLDSDLSHSPLDSSLSEQFNRSLFMPSVRGLKSSWSYQLQRYGIALGVFLLGMLIGLGATRGPSWIPDLVGTYSIVKTPVGANESQNDAEQDDLQNEPQPPTEGQQVASEVSAAQNNVAVESEIGVQALSTDLAATENTVQINRHPLDVELSDEEIERRIIRPQQGSDAPVSSELLSRFNKALAELEESSQDTPDIVEDSAPNIIRIDQLPGWALSSLPNMSFSTHMFASARNDRWVRVNDIEMQEGDWINGEVQIVEITQHHVILNYKGQSFRMAALTDW